MDKKERYRQLRAIYDRLFWNYTERLGMNASDAVENANYAFEWLTCITYSDFLLDEYEELGVSVPFCDRNKEG